MISTQTARFCQSLTWSLLTQFSRKASDSDTAELLY